MAVHTASTQSTDHTVAAEPAPAEPAPVQRARTDLAVGAAAGRSGRAHARAHAEEA